MINLALSILAFLFLCYVGLFIIGLVVAGVAGIGAAILPIIDVIFTPFLWLSRLGDRK